MATETKAYDLAERLSDEAEIFHYLDTVFEDGDPALIKFALKNVARARGMSEIARQANLSRPSLYKALGEDGNPSIQTLSAILSVFGLKLSVTKIRAS